MSFRIIIVFSVEAMAKGYQMYRDGNAFEEHPCKRERGNWHDLFQVRPCCW